MLACPFPFAEFSWKGRFHSFNQFARNVDISAKQRKYQHMWQKIAIDGKFSPNIVFIIADAVDDEDSAVHVSNVTTVGTIANAPGLIPANPVTIPVPLNIPIQLLSKTHVGWRTWTTLFREYCSIADDRDVQLAINAYKATSNVCIHVDNIGSFPEDNPIPVRRSAPFRYSNGPGPQGPFEEPASYRNVSPSTVIDHFLLSTLPPGYGICNYNQIIASERPVLELPESSDLKIAMRMVNMTGPTAKMSIGDAFIQKVLMPELLFHINAVLVNEFEKFVASNGVHMAEVSFSAFTYHHTGLVHYTGLEQDILDRMKLLWECEFIRYSGKSAGITWQDSWYRSITDIPADDLISLRRSHLPWFDRLHNLDIVKQYRRNLDIPDWRILLYNKTQRDLWSENEALDTYIRRCIDPSFRIRNSIQRVSAFAPSGDTTILHQPIVSASIVRHGIVAHALFLGDEPGENTGHFRHVSFAYWPDTLMDRYCPWFRSQIDRVIISFTNTLGQVVHPITPKNAYYKQFRNYGSSEIPELLADGSDDPLELFVV